jgi:hypothetical protein
MRPLSADFARFRSLPFGTPRGARFSAALSHGARARG